MAASKTTSALAPSGGYNKEMKSEAKESRQKRFYFHHKATD